MGRPKGQLTADITAARLLAAAEKEFVAKGFSATRLEDIASAVGLTRPSLLHHFASKEKLYSTVVERLVARLRMTLLDGMATRGTFRERLEATVGRFAEHVYDDPTPLAILVREMQDARGTGEELLREQVLPILDLVEEFIRGAGQRELVPGMDVRAGILHVFGSVVFFAVAGKSRGLLWPQTDRAAFRAHIVTLSRQLFTVPADLSAQEIA